VQALGFLQATCSGCPEHGPSLACYACPSLTTYACLPCSPAPSPPPLLQPFGFPISHAYIWGAVGFMWGMLIVYTLGAVAALRFTNPRAPQPTGACSCPWPCPCPCPCTAASTSTDACMRSGCSRMGWW